MCIRDSSYCHRSYLRYHLPYPNRFIFSSHFRCDARFLPVSYTHLMPSDVDETPLGALERLRSIPSLIENNSIGQGELNIASFFEKEQAFASTFNQDILPYMEDMTHWLIKEAIYIPLDAGMVEYGVKNDAVHRDFPINTLFSRDVFVGETVVYP